MDSTIIILIIIGIIIYAWNQDHKHSSRKNRYASSPTRHVAREQYSVTVKAPGLGSEQPTIARVAGVTFEGRQSVVSSLHIGEQLRLIPEPDNIHDPNAIKIVRANDQQVGYLSRELAEQISWWFEASMFEQYAEVIELTGDRRNGYNLGVTIKFFPPSKDEVMATSNYMYPPPF